MVFLTLAGLGLSIFMIVTSKQTLQAEKDYVAELEPNYEKVKSLSALADAVVAKAVPINRNVELARAMLDHNKVYPDAYDYVRKYVPSFYRINQMSITPVDEKNVQLTMSGALKTRQEYDDLYLALLRVPKQTAVTRSAYVPLVVKDYVPNVKEGNMLARKIKAGEGDIPIDAEAEVNRELGKGSVTGFRGVGDFGTQATSRGAMPDYQTVTTSVTFELPIKVVQAKATLAKAGAAPAPTPAGTATPTAAAGGSE